MSDAKQCDRCGKLYANHIVQQIQMPIWSRTERYKTLAYWDLCDECAEEFEKFMKIDKVDEHRDDRRG